MGVQFFMEIVKISAYRVLYFELIDKNMIDTRTKIRQKV